MRMQGLNSNGEIMSSVYVEKNNDDPSIGVDCSNLPSLTRQEFAEECDINVLMSRYEKTGEIPRLNQAQPQYLDLEAVAGMDLQTAMNILNDATTSFMRLPAKIRGEFENDPMRFVAFAEDPANLEQLRTWGLAKPAEPPPAPQKVELVNPEAIVPPPPEPAKKP